MKSLHAVLAIGLLLSVSGEDAAQRAGNGRGLKRRETQPLVSNAADIARRAQDSAWQAAGEATEARAGTSHLRAQISNHDAKISADEADVQAPIVLSIAPQAATFEAQAQKGLDDANKAEEEAKKLIDGVDQASYDAAKKGAEDEVAKMKGEASAYYASLQAELEALENPPPDTKAAAAAKAAQPYIDVVLRVSALVAHYQAKVEEFIAQAGALTAQAQGIAVQAQGEQALGDGVMAQRHMMQAHGMIGLANVKKADALKVRKLVESLNMSIPNYQKAAQMATEHVLATFVGLQEAAIGNPQAKKAVHLDNDPLAIQKKIFEEAHERSTQILSEVDAGVESMSCSIDAAEHQIKLKKA